MTVEIICGDISALPSSDHATELLPLTDGDTLTISCTDSDLKAAYRVLRAIMDYGYDCTTVKFNIKPAIWVQIK